VRQRRVPDGRLLRLRLLLPLLQGQVTAVPPSPRPINQKETVDVIDAWSCLDALVSALQHMKTKLRFVHHVDDDDDDGIAEQRLDQRHERVEHVQVAFTHTLGRPRAVVVQVTHTRVAVVAVVPHRLSPHLAVV
jgi:hypothetical protein